ncbi:PAS domain S-box protein [Bradyrhizobium aeschynomenes]|uniref:PAS domain S-box protein n=1 Tax=Bradyrhizobium aeschynomenes TaxID=2734909 RepID=UPI001556D311|nr:PAS domain S-box protein [Bradyrhizobium aeschynomenes]
MSVGLHEEINRSFLAGGGEAGRLIRTFDWSQTSLGPIEHWPQSLRTAAAILLRSPVPMVMLWGGEGVMLYNDAYSVLAGARHPKLLGSKVREGWPEVTDFNDNVMTVVLAGGTLHYSDQELTLFRHGRPEQVFMNLDYSPVVDESGVPVGVLAIVVETTERVLAERRRASLIALDERLRDFPEAADLSFAASKILGEALGACRVGYGVLDVQARSIQVERNWSAPGFSDVGGLHYFERYGAYFDELLQGLVVANLDVTSDPRTALHASAFEELGIRAHLDVPVIEDGRAVAEMFVHSAVPRVWTEEEIAFVRDFTRRTRGAIARREAEQALRASEARLAAVIDSLPVGVGIFGADGYLTLSNPEARRFLQTNRIPSSDPVSAPRWRGWAADGELLKPEDFPGARAIRGERVVPGVEVLFTDDDGREIWTTVAAVPIKNRDGRVTSFSLAISNIDTVKRTGMELRESEERFRQLAEAVDQVFYITDVNAGRLLYLSPAYERVWGRPASELLADLTLFLRTIHPDDQERVAAMAPRQAAGEPFEIEYRIVRPDGQVRFIRDRAFPVKADGIRRYAGVADDVTERRQATAWFEGVFNSDLMGFTIFDARTGETLAINDHFLAMTGYSRLDFEQGRWDWRDITVPDHLAKDEAAIAQAHERGWWEPYEKEYRLRDSRLLPVRIASAPLPGELGRVVVSIEDISERRAAETALRESEALARQRAEEIAVVYDAAPIGLCVFDRELRYVRINERLAEINGKPVADHIGRTVREMVPGIDDQAVSMLHRVLAGEAIFGAEFVGETPAQPGVMRTWRENWLPLRNAAGDIVGITVSAEEVTEAKRVEAELRQLNATLEQRVAERTAERHLLATIVDTTEEQIQALDLNYRWLAINPACVDAYMRLYGIRPRIGDSLLELLAHKPEHLEPAKAMWARALAGTAFTASADWGDPQLGRRSYEMRFEILRDASGRQLGAFLTGRDVTQRLDEQNRLAQAEEALRQSQKMEAMGQLTGGVAHDFNNLLTPIVGALDLLQRRGLGSEREQRLISGAMQSAERAKTLVQRLLAFARRQPLQAVSVDVGALVVGMAELVSSTTGPQIEVVVDVASDLPAAKADPNQLEMALLNLAVNARDAMPRGGTLRISAKAASVEPRNDRALRPGDYVWLSVADTGVGMDEATIARAVEPFFSTKGIGKGTGLGLSMVHGLASQLGGALTINSRPGLGTNIELWLPRSDMAPEIRSSSFDARVLVGPRGHALLVDDEDLVRASTADMLEGLGFSIVEAASAEEALRFVHQGEPIDLLVTDHLMPGMSGVELARLVLAARPDAGVLIISGYAETEGLAPDLARLSKPFKSDELASALAQVLGPLRPL